MSFISLNDCKTACNRFAKLSYMGSPLQKDTTNVLYKLSQKTYHPKGNSFIPEKQDK